MFVVHPVPRHWCTLELHPLLIFCLDLLATPGERKDCLPIAVAAQPASSKVDGCLTRTLLSSVALHALHDIPRERGCDRKLPPCVSSCFTEPPTAAVFKSAGREAWQAHFDLHGVHARSCFACRLPRCICTSHPLALLVPSALSLSLSLSRFLSLSPPFSPRLMTRTCPILRWNQKPSVIGKHCPLLASPLFSTPSCAVVKPLC